MKHTLVLGIGNILLRDEGVGVRVIEAMQGIELPDGVELVDGGTSGADLIETIADRPRLFVVDAVQADVEPGTILRFGPDDLLAETVARISLHQVGLLDTLLMARHLGCEPREVVIFAVKPKDVAPGLDLSAEVAAVVPQVIDRILAELDSGPCCG